MRAWIGKHRAAAAASLVGAVLAALVAGVAIVYPGFAAQRMTLDDGTVWVVNNAEQAIGRANPEVVELNAVVETEGSAGRIVQSGGTVLFVDPANATLDIVDPVEARLGERVPLPPDLADVQLVGDRVVIHATGTGELWIVPVAELGSFDPVAAPALRLGEGASVSAIPDGGMFAVAPALGEVYRLDVAHGGGILASWSVPLDEAAAGVQITSVAGHWAVLDPGAGLVHLETGPLPLGTAQAAGARLQQPSALGGAVLIATTNGLVSVPLDGGLSTSLVGGQAGTPAAPLVAEGCVFAAWTGGTAWRDCSAESSTPGATDLALAEMPAAADLAFADSVGAVVLNDAAGGASWAVADAGQLIDNWSALIPPDEEQEEILDEETPVDLDANQKPPIAVDDDFGARPGRASVLPVLLNDYDPNGDVLVISSFEAVDEAVGRVDLVARNQQLQLSLEPDARGTIELRYTITDGRGGDATARLVVEIRQDSENFPPRQVRSSTMTVVGGGRMSQNVLGDWIDPDGDPIYLTAVAVGETGAASAKPDGVVVFSDTQGQAGRTTLAVTMSDGRSETTGSMPVEIRPRAEVPITVEPGVALAAAGEQITIQPLRQARSGGTPVRLGAVPEKPGVTIVPNFDNGTFVFSSDRIGTHYLSVTVTDGERTGTGIVRVEVFTPPESGTRPITVPQTVFVRSLDSATFDPTLTDIDPAGGVLVVTGVEDVPAGGALTAEILDQHEVRITLEEPLGNGPATLHYRISNGVADAEGTITVVEIPDPTRVQPPLAGADSVTVRVGDVVDIPVLANDEQPDGQRIELVPELVEGLPAGGGLIFASGDFLRYLAPEKAGDYQVVYSVRGEDGQTAQAIVRIAVREADAESNEAPVPRIVTARVLAGESVRIEVPLSSIDPDGDAVQLVGIASTPEKGTVLSSTDGAIEYEAGDYSSGTDVFRYVVVDGLGARAEGTIRVGISPRLEGARNPVANEDAVQIRPDRKVSVQVLANDSDPDGSPLRVVSAAPSFADGTEVEVVEDEIVRVDPPSRAGQYSVVYTIENEYGGQSSAFVTVTVDPEAPLSAPVARDTVLSVSDVIDRETVDVDVLDNVFFADGDVSELHLELVPGFSTAVLADDRRVQVTIGGVSQIIPFVVAHPEDPLVRAYAFVWVPGYEDALPQLDRFAPPLEVVSEETLVIELNERIVALGGERVRITDAGTVSATHANGEPLVADADTLVFTSADRYFGPASITLEVTDGVSSDDPNGRRAVLTLPITVTPRENQPPVFIGAVVDFEPGQSKELDLIRLTNYPYDDIDELTYTLLEPLPEGFGVEMNGQRVVITADFDTPVGTSQVARIGVRDAVNEGESGLIRLGVVPSTRPLAVPAADSAVTRRGQTTMIDVLANDQAGNPFPGEPLSVVAIRGLDGGSLPDGVSITPDATNSVLQVSVSPSAEPVDTALQYQLADVTGDPSRYVWGGVTISIQDVPDPVTSVTVNEFLDKGLRLSWVPGAANNSPIDHFEVRMTRVEDGSVYSTTTCASTVNCHVDTPGNGPANAVRLAVVAVNEIGRSDPVQNSGGAIWSDIVPPAPTGLGWEPIDHGLTVTWTKPETNATASPIDRYLVTVAGETQTLAVGPADPAGTTYSLSIGGIAGVANGSSQGYSVSARNAAPSNLATWNQANGTGIPAWTPLVVGTPSASGASSAAGTTVTMSWDGAFTPNGKAITGYSVRIDSGSVGSCESATPVGTATSHEFTGLAPNQSYTVSVFASNGLGGCSAPASAGVITRATPGPVSTISISGPEANGAGRWDYRITSVDSSPAGTGTLRYRVVGDGVDGSQSEVVPLGALLAAGGTQYGRSISVEVKACAAWPEVTLCSADWSAAFPVGTPVENAAPPGLTAAVTETSEDPLSVTGDWTWNDRPAGSYDLVEYDCGSGRVVMDAGPGSCTTSGQLEPGPLTVIITEDGVEYPRSWPWTDFD